MEEITATAAMEMSATVRTAEAIMPLYQNLLTVTLVMSFFGTLAALNASSSNSRDTAKPAPTPVASTRLMTN